MVVCWQHGSAPESRLALPISQCTSVIHRERYASASELSFPNPTGNTHSSMTCMRKFALKRSYNARKARSEHWRQQHEAEIEETNASPAPRGSDSPPATTHSPPPSTHPPPPPPQSSTSSTSADQAQPATSVSTGSPLPEPFVPRGNTTFITHLL